MVACVRWVIDAGSVCIAVRVLETRRDAANASRGILMSQEMVIQEIVIASQSQMATNLALVKSEPPA